MKQHTEKCPSCRKKGGKSKLYPNTYYCDNCKDYFGEQAEIANEPLLIGD